MTPYFIISTVLCLGIGLLPVSGSDRDWLNPVRSSAASAVTAYSSVLGGSSVVLAKTYAMGTTGTKGLIGEQFASSSYLQGHLQKSGNWRAISPRVGAQGIDHIFLKIDRDSGLPRDIIVGESKYGSSQLGMTKDGLQLTSPWCNKRLIAMGNRYFQLAEVPASAVHKPPFLGGNQEMKVILKNGKEAVFWRNSSQDSWKFGGEADELAEAQKMARAYGQRLTAAGNGEIRYRARLFQIVPKGNDLQITIRDAEALNSVRSASALKKTGEITLSNVLNKKMPVETEKAIAKVLKSKYTAWSDREINSLAKKMTMQTRDSLQPFSKAQMLGTFAIQSGVAGLSAMALDAVFRYGCNGETDLTKIMLTGSAVFIGAMGAQCVEAAIAQMAMASGALNATGIAPSVMATATGAVAGGIFTGALMAYAGYSMGYYDIEQAHVMTLTSGISAGIGTVAGLGTMAAIATFGTAGTGTAIASLSGAAATSASFALIGGGSALIGGTILTGGTLIVAVAATMAISYGVEYYIAH